jgi:crossover junction endodeoxyribonuclease RuvC
MTGSPSPSGSPYLPSMPVIFGLDPSLRSTGYGIISVEGRTLSALAYGVIENPARIIPSRCLVAIHQRITDLLQQYRPDAAAVEGIIYLQNYQTAITLGSARGAALLALAEAGLPIYEYAPRRVKSAATGRGGAQKAQVGFMMRAMLGLTENPPPDAADALAIAMTHAQNTGVCSKPKEI